ncbi:hypothetical protein ILUMI_22582 [Ignelater luminosus]|uniref:PDZ domain-containing protein n=1 Tax=Ignelater luminosus TaxID=2038154 RepID=A0A8K0G0E1_IGNLU|nr:hypothetical protein ILUMI_22582 [Ignelater luminosus]
MAEGTNITDQSTSSKQTANKDGMDFVTVVSVGSEETSVQQSDEEKSSNDEVSSENDQQNSGYVTVLKIGQTNSPPKEVVEEVLVYRLPGERLGFGLKFEGGTKAAEFVKRLFIQSCAPDSPASMVHCSWGKLTEGDEVLNIDSLPVTSMTRIDCVRCLKDSNVVIKLLVRHFYNKTNEDVPDNNDSSAKPTEDLPHVIGAEKKRTPPPPPPVPPRKIPRKMLKENNNNIAVNANTTTETDFSPLHNNNNEIIVNGHRNSRFHSPRSSGKFAHSRQSPEVSRHVLRDRRLSDDSVGPPDAEVYLDLFSQESGCNLSESDDTGSSISTIIDRFSSIPTTTNSSLAGSLPSTPTSVQKQLDVSNITNPFDNNDLEAFTSDNYLFSKLVSSVNGINEDEFSLLSKNNEEASPQKIIKDSETGNEEGNPLQPPMNFQDAPLSYGNEDVGVVEASVKVAVTESASKYIRQNNTPEMADENGNCLKQSNVNKVTNKTQDVTAVKVRRTENKKRPPPPPPPCEKPKVASSENKDSKEHRDVGNEVADQGSEINALDLPRLVHFVPKSSGSDNRLQCDNLSETIESTKLFLENEIRISEKLLPQKSESIEDNIECSLETASAVPEIYTSELYNLTWSLSPQLATIGEDDEEGCQENYCHKSPNTSTPIVIIENADSEKRESENSLISSERSDTPDGSGSIIIDDIQKSEDESISPDEPKITSSSSSDVCETMEAPPSASRQPPDDQQSSCSVRDKIAIFSNASKSNDLISTKKISESADDILVKRSVSALCKTGINSLTNERTIKKQTNNSSRSSLDLTSTSTGTNFLSEEKLEKPIQKHSTLSRLHTRSQSLMDISNTDLIPKKDRWNLLAEQRQRSLSKLKGLIIPERVVEIDLPNVVDLPEIKSSDSPSVVNNANLPVTSAETPIVPCQRNISVPSLSVPPWSNPNSNNIPKYSPAFKRKSLQLHSDISSKIDINSNENASSSVNEVEIISTKLNQKQLPIKSIYDNHVVKITGNLCLADAPKSLESITSPTRSDCSFEYNTSPDIRTYKQEQLLKANQLDARIGLGILNKGREDLGKSEDESDNDSAVSSSQSSYISRTSPPTSPSHLHSNFTSRSCTVNESDSLTQLKCHSTGSSQSCDNQNHRLLKPQSVEAINRKNILASAKCRSGRDLKIGSPLIQRRFEEESAAENVSALQLNNNDLEYNSPKYYRKCATIYEKVNDVPIIPQNNITQSEIPAKEEDHLFVNNKPDLTNDCGMQRWVRNESKYTVEHTRSNNINENNLKASINTSTTSAESVTPHKEIKNENKSIAREVFNLTNGQERRATITRPLTREVRSTSSPASVQPPVKPPTPTEETISSSKELTNKDIEIIVLRPEIPGGSVGITLAGGADYENKEITVHKIREDSSAHRDGRLQKGDKVVSINGKNVDGLTHKELVALLKEPLPEVTLAISKQQKKPLDITPSRKSSISAEDLVTIKQKDKANPSTKQRIFVVSLVKDVAGLGLSLEGGKDSLLGNMPLLIKKVFKGGAAEKCGNLQVGDELLLVNETEVSSMSRFEAWSVLKKLPEGITISLTIKR